MTWILETDKKYTGSEELECKYVLSMEPKVDENTIFRTLKSS